MGLVTMVLGLTVWVAATHRRWRRRRWWWRVRAGEHEAFAVVPDREATVVRALLPVLCTRAGRGVLVRLEPGEYRQNARPTAIAGSCAVEPPRFFELLWDVLEPPGRYPQNAPSTLSPTAASPRGSSPPARARAPVARGAAARR